MKISVPSKQRPTNTSSPHIPLRFSAPQARSSAGSHSVHQVRAATTLQVLEYMVSAQFPMESNTF